MDALNTLVTLIMILIIGLILFIVGILILIGTLIYLLFETLTSAIVTKRKKIEKGETKDAKTQ